MPEDLTPRYKWKVVSMLASRSWCVKTPKTMHNSVLSRVKAFHKRVRAETATLTGVFCGKKVSVRK